MSRYRDLLINAEKNEKALAEKLKELARQKAEQQAREDVERQNTTFGMDEQSRSDWFNRYFDKAKAHNISNERAINDARTINRMINNQVRYDIATGRTKPQPRRLTAKEGRDLAIARLHNQREIEARQNELDALGADIDYYKSSKNAPKVDLDKIRSVDVNKSNSSQFDFDALRNAPNNQNTSENTLENIKNFASTFDAREHMSDADKMLANRGYSSIEEMEADYDRKKTDLDALKMQNNIGASRTTAGKFMQDKYGEGNVDLTNREQVKNSDGTYSTVASEWQDVDINGTKTAVHYTPIANGKYLSNDELQSYLNELYDGVNSSQEILERDKVENGGLGIILRVKDNFDFGKENAWDMSLHKAQDNYYRGTFGAYGATTKAQQNQFNAADSYIALTDDQKDDIESNDSFWQKVKDTAGGIYNYIGRGNTIAYGGTENPEVYYKSDTQKMLEDKYQMDSKKARYYAENYDNIKDIVATGGQYDAFKAEAEQYSQEERDLLEQYVSNNTKAKDSTRQVGAHYKVLSDEAYDGLKALGWNDGQIKEAAKRYKVVLDTDAYNDQHKAITDAIMKSNAQAVKYNALDLATFLPASAKGVEESILQWTGQEYKNPYASGYNLLNMANITEEATNEKIGNPVGQFFYGAGMSTAKSFETMAIGMGVGQLAGSLGIGEKAAKALINLSTLPAFGSSSYQATLKEATERGLGTKKATRLAVASGINEMFFEMFSLDKTYDIFKKYGGKKTKEILTKGWVDMLVQAGIEGSEEGATDLANWAADEVINNTFSEYEQLIKQVGRKEASRQFRNRFLTDIAAGTFSGLFSGGATMAGSAVVTNITTNDAAKAVLGNERATKELVSAALNMNKDSKAYKVASSLEEGAMPTKKQVREIIESAGKETSVREAVKNALVDSGMTEKQAENSLANIAIARYTGNTENLTEQELAQNTAIDDETYAENNAADTIGRAVNYAKQERDNQKKKLNAKEVNNETKAKMDTAQQNIESKVDSENADDITSVASIENGVATYNLKDGSTVSSEEAVYKNDDIGLAYETSIQMGYDAKTTNEVVSMMSSKPENISASDFLMGINEAYRYGQIGYTLNKVNSQGYINGLTKAQREFAYKAGEEASQRKADQRASELATPSVRGTRSGKVHFASSLKDLSERQRSSMTLIEKMTAEVTHNDVFVYESVVNEKGERVFSQNIAGYKAGDKAPNGFYKNGVIYLDINAGNKGEGTMLWTYAHELTHFVRDWNPTKFKTLGDFVIGEYAKAGVPVEELVARQIQKAKDNEHSLTWDEAYEEVVADSMQQMFTDNNVAEKIAKLKQQDMTLWQKVKEWFENLAKEIASAYKGLVVGTPEADAMLKVQKQVDRIADMFAESVVEAGNTYEATHREIDAKSFEKVMKRELKNRDILNHDRFVEPHLDLINQNYNAENAAIELDTLLKRYNKVIDIWREIGGELNSKFLNDWNNQEYKDRAFAVFKAQSGYKYNAELSTMCKKGIPLFEAIDTIVKKEITKQLNTDVIGKAEKEILYDLLKSKGFEIPCAICYVEQARQREGVIIDAFINGKVDTDKNGKPKKTKLGWNATLDRIETKMKELGVDYSFDTVSRDIATEKYVPKNIDMDEKTQGAFYEALRQVANEEIARYNKEDKPKNPKKAIKEATPEAVNAVLKGTLPSNLKIFKLLFNDKNSRIRLESDLLYSSMTTRNLAQAHNGLYSLFNSQGGVSGYKTKQGTVVYLGEIIKKTWTPEQTKKEGGIRNQSNSDFMMYTLLDQAQIYVDLSAKGYYLHAYTKVLAELKLFGLSGAKINASLIPAVNVIYNKDGSVNYEETQLNAGLDENGNPIYDDFEGINHEEAFMLLEDSEYSKNVSGICIGYSDKHIMKLLDDSRVQEIIGFHDKTDDPNKRYKGARYAKNYNGLNEATKLKADGTTETKHIGFNQFVIKAEKMFSQNADGDFEGMAKHKGKTYVADDIPRLATDLYLEYCEKKNLIPAYHIAVGEDANGNTIYMSDHPNYYKLMGDFGLRNSEGKYAPHKKVQFNMPSTVPYLENGQKKTMPTKDFIKAELEKELKVRDDIANALADESEDGIIPQFVERVNSLNETKFSTRDSRQDIYHQMAEEISGLYASFDGYDYMDNYMDGMEEDIANAIKDGDFSYLDRIEEIYEDLDESEQKIADRLFEQAETLKSNNADIRYSDRVSNDYLAAQDDTALYIKNTKNANYIGMIFKGIKTEETRTTRSLDKFIGKDFYVTDGKKVYGTIRLGEPHKYTSEEFHKKENRKKHRVPKGDEYDIKPNGIKWAYPIETYSKFKRPLRLSESKDYKNSFQARQIIYLNRTYSYSELVNKPNMVGHIISENVLMNGSNVDFDDLTQRVKNKCKKIVDANSGKTTYYIKCDDLNENIEISNRGITHSALDKSGNKNESDSEIINARAALDLPNILKNAIEVNVSERPNNADVPSESILLGTVGFKDGNAVEYYGVKLVVENRENNSRLLVAYDVVNKLYSVNAKKIDPANASPAAAANGTYANRFAISIKDLIDGVNDEFNDIFSVDVYNNLGKTRATTDDTSYLLYSDRDINATDNRTLLSNAMLSVAQNDIERGKIEQYQQNIAKMNEEQNKLVELRKEIKELSFGKGKRDTERLKVLKKEATETANRITTYDKALLRLEASKPLMNVLEREKDKAYKRAKDAGKEALDRYREKSLKKQQDIVDKYNERIKRDRERRKNTDVRNRIKKLVEELKSRDFNPRVNKYIPRDLIRPVNELLSVLNMDSGRSEKLTERLAVLKSEYDKIAKDPKYAVNYDENVSEMIGDLASNIGNTSIYDMTKEQLEMTYNTLKALMTQIRDAVKVHNIKSNKNVFEVSSEMRKETASVKHGSSGVFARWLQAGLRPETMFERMAGFKKNSMWAKVYKMLDKGQLNMMRIEMESNEIFADVFKDMKYVKSLSKDMVDIGLRDDGGNKVVIPRGMMLTIYKALMNEDNARHIMVGGITVPEISKYYKGSDDAYGIGHIVCHGIGSKGLSDLTVEMSELNEELREAEENGDEAEEKRLKEEIKALEQERAELINDGNAYMTEIKDNIEQLLNDTDRTFLDAAAKYFDEYSKNELNKVTMELYGFEKATVDNYMPIHTDANFRQASFEQITRDFNLENSGFMKDRVKATNPIMLEDFSDLINRQIQKVSKYCGLTIAVRDFGKIYSMSDRGFAESLQDTIASKFGKPAQKYIDNLMSDIVGSRQGETTFLDRARGYMAGATLSLNPRVALAQAASLPTAASELGWKAVAKASGKMFTHHDLELIAKYSPLLYNRSNGANIEAADVKRMAQVQNRLMRNLNWLMGWIESIDKRTVGTLWYASQYYVDDNFKDLQRGTDEYYTKVAEVFNNTVERTQPNYTTMQRPDILRNPHAVVKQLTMFMTQRLQNANIVYDSVSRLVKYNSDYRKGINEVTQADVREAGLDVYRSVTSQVAAASMIVGIKFLVDLMLHSLNGYRDDDEELTKESIRWSLINNFAESIISNVIGGSEVYAVGKSIVTKERYYGISLNGVDVYVDAISNFVALAQSRPEDDQTWSEYLSDNMESIIDKADKLIKSLATFKGIPYGNAEKIVKGVYYHIKDYSNGEFGSFEAGVERSKKQDSRRLYSFILNKDKYNINKLKEKYDDKYESAVIDALVGGDSRITQMARYKIAGDLDSYLGLAKEVKAEKNFSQDQIIKAMNRVIYQLTKDDEKEKASDPLHKGWFTNEDIGIAIEEKRYGDIDIIEDYLEQTKIDNDKTEEEAEKAIDSAITSAIKDAVMAGDIDKENAIKILVNNAGKSDDDAKELVDYWNSMKEYPDSDISQSGYKEYQSVANTGISMETFEEFYNTARTIAADKDKSGKTIEDSRKKKVANYINSLPLTKQQKYALFLTEYKVDRSELDDYWTLYTSYTKYNISKAGYDKYLTIKDTGITMDTFSKFYNTMGTITGDIDAKGDSIPYSKMKKVIAYIDSLPISREQKNTLYLTQYKELNKKYITW